MEELEGSLEELGSSDAEEEGGTDEDEDGVSDEGASLGTSDGVSIMLDTSEDEASSCPLPSQTSGILLGA